VARLRLLRLLPGVQGIAQELFLDERVEGRIADWLGQGNLLLERQRTPFVWG